MSNYEVIGWCRGCGKPVIDDEPLVACDAEARTTGDAADEGQCFLAHPACAELFPSAAEQTA